MAVFLRLAILYCFITHVNICAAQEWETQIDSFSTFSSPKAFDLNGDNVKDIVIGCGFEYAPDDGVFAFNGVNGEILWFTPTEHEVYGPAVPVYITGDDIPDFVMNGRFAALYAIDGSNGEIIWDGSDVLPRNPRTLLFYNVFTPCVIEDVDSDGVNDILFTYGGGGGFYQNDTLEHAFVGIVSGMSGDLLQFLTMPTESQTYMPPVLIDGPGGTDVLLGTGGETHRGELFRVPLQSIISGNLDGLVTVATNANKGYIQPPALADLNGDGFKDIMVANLDHQIFAYDGVDNRNIYTNYFPEMEFYGGITPGYFNDDEILDFAVLGGTGDWPSYYGYRRFIIDVTVGGGTLIDEIGGGLEVVNSGISYQPDEQVQQSRYIYTRNHVYNDSVKMMQLVEYDPFTETLSILAEADSATVIGSVPLIEDLDGDGLMELIFATSDYSTGFGKPDNGFTIRSLDLDITGISDWSGYMGNLSNSHWQGETFIVSALDEYDQLEEASIYPNPFIGSITVKLDQHQVFNGIPEVTFYGIDGKIWRSIQVQITTNGLEILVPEEIAPGAYYLGISDNTIFLRSGVVIHH